MGGSTSWVPLAMVFVCLGALHGAQALDNGLARTPPMGWLSWEWLRCQTDCASYPDACVNEQLYRSMADALVDGGYAAAGYNRVNVDDCWANMARDAATGRMVGDSSRFPSGMKALGDYIHSKGLLYGIYSDVGTKTCGGYPGSEGHFNLDAQTFAEWGVDSLKLDGCNANTGNYSKSYPAMTAALNATGRPILYSCSWPAYIDGGPPYAPFEEIAKSCNLWRSWHDVQDSWQSVLSIIRWWDSVQDLQVPAAGPGNWNDPDMIIAGNYGLSVAQARTQFALWAIYAAPLYLSSDIRQPANDYTSIVLNKGVIAVNQDPLGKQGKLLFNITSGLNQRGVVSVYSRTLSGGDTAVALFYEATAGSPTNVTVPLAKLGLTAAPSTYTVTDLWAGQPHALVGDSLQAMVAPHDTAIYRFAVKQ